MNNSGAIKKWNNAKFYFFSGNLIKSMKWNKYK
jgi:hypothetical protein